MKLGGDTWIRWSWQGGEKHRHVQPKVRPSMTFSVTSHSRDWEMIRDCQSEYCFFVNYLEAIYFLSHHGLTAHTFSSHLHCHSPWCNHPHDDLIGHQHPLNLPQYLVLHSATETHSRTKRAPCNSWVSRRLWLIALSVCSQGLECFGVCSSHGRRS